MKMITTAPTSASRFALSVPTCQPVAVRIAAPHFEQAKWQKSAVTTGLMGLWGSVDRGYDTANVIRVRDVARATKPAAPPRGEPR